MLLVFPSEEYEQKAKDFVQEFYDNSSEINGDGGLEYYLRERTYSEWLVKVRRDIDLANIPEDRAPQLNYFCIREEDGVIVGMVATRLVLNDFLPKEAGHIGYCVRPSERRKGYATFMLTNALAFLRRIGQNNIIIICDASNVASAGVIRKCGGILETEFYSDTFQTNVQKFCMK